MPIGLIGLPHFITCNDFFLRYWYENGCIFPNMGTTWLAIDKADRTNGCLKVLTRKNSLLDISTSIRHKSHMRNYSLVARKSYRCGSLIVDYDNFGTFMSREEILLQES